MTSLEFTEVSKKGVAEITKHLGDYLIEVDNNTVIVKDVPAYRVEWELKKLRKPFNALKRLGKTPWNGVKTDGIWAEHNLSSEY
jgi:hypothetical protein